MGISFQQILLGKLDILVQLMKLRLSYIVLHHTQELT